MKNQKPLEHNKIVEDLNKALSQLEEFRYVVYEFQTWIGADGYTNLACLVTHPEKEFIKHKKIVLPIIVRETWQIFLNFQPDWETAKNKLRAYTQQELAAGQGQSQE